jgi:hypothetical protein
LEFKHYRYLKLAAWVFVASFVAYVWHRNQEFSTPGGVGYGGTWMGYTLGGIASLLILWLLWLGIRKRRYRASSSSLQGWVSAHVYFGVAALFIALLHSGFEFGLNLHSLTLSLLALVVVSGIYGVLIYVRVPAYMTGKIGQDSLEGLFRQIHVTDLQARKAALQLSDEFNTLIVQAAEGTRMSGAWFDTYVRARLRPCPTDLAVSKMQLLVANLKDDQARQGREVFALMVSRQAAVRAVRQELRSLASLKRWLLWHVPLSVALLFALAAHIVSVFIYW